MDSVLHGISYGSIFTPIIGSTVGSKFLLFKNYIKKNRLGIPVIMKRSLMD